MFNAIKNFLTDDSGIAVEWLIVIIMAAIIMSVFFVKVKPGANTFSNALGKSFERIVK